MTMFMKWRLSSQGNDYDQEVENGEEVYYGREV
jgi:hypothetical protein